MRDKAMNLSSTSVAMRRLITLLIVAAVALMVLPLQPANAQEFTTSSTTMPVEATDDDWNWGLEPTEDPAAEATTSVAAEPTRTSKATTSAAHPDDYAEAPSSSEETSSEPVPTETTAEPTTETTTSVAPTSESPAAALRSLRSVFGTMSASPNPTFDSYKQQVSHLTDPDLWFNRTQTPNPTIAPRCGISIALVFDLSKSIGTSGLKASKDTGKKVLKSLEGSSGTTLGIFSFDTKANRNASKPSLNMASQQDVTAANRTIDALETGMSGKGNNWDGGGTNWQDGLQQINESSQHYDYVYFITDGVPTTSNKIGNNQRPDDDWGYVTHNKDIDLAIKEANILKAKNTRLEILAVEMGTSENTILRDEVVETSGDGMDDLGNFNLSLQGLSLTNQLNHGNPGFRWRNGAGNSNWQDLVNSRAMAPVGRGFYLLGGAEVTAVSEGRTDPYNEFLKATFRLPTYTFTQPNSLQITSALSESVTEIENYDDLNLTLERMLPPSCITTVQVDKSVVDQNGNKDASADLSGWKFTVKDRPVGFTHQSSYPALATTGSNGKAEWRFNTETPQDQGEVTILEDVPSNRDGLLERIVCRDGDGANIPVTKDGQRFTIQVQSSKDYICAVENKLPGFEVATTAASDQNPDLEGVQAEAGVNADGTFTAYYTVDVTNKSKKTATLKENISNTVTFPAGFSVTKVTYSFNGQVIGESTGSQWTIPANALGSFGTEATKSVTVTVTGLASSAGRQSVLEGSYKNCGTSGGGFLNKVFMKGDANPNNNTACVDLVILDVLLKLLKVDQEDATQPLSGAEFTLYESNNGQIGNQVAVFEPGLEDNSHATTVDVGGEYFIVETRAPATYSLLPAPIRISVNAGQNGIEVQVLNREEAFSATSKVSDEPGVAILQVADLQSGALPKSGGMGVVPFAVVALLILGLGAFMLRRRM